MPARRGVEHHFAKLTPDQVREIRELREQRLSYHKIADLIEWAVAPSTIQDICDRTIWRHIE